jgi:DNA-binding NtrC family response regulator
MADAEQRLLMLIDDEPAQSRLITALAAREGWRTIVVRDSEAAIATLGTRQGMQLSAIILDQWVPGDEACELIRELKDRRPGLPILMLTTSTSPLLAVEAMRAGATDYLVKPAAPDRLMQALRNTTTREAPQDELMPLTEKMAATLDFDSMVGTASPFRDALAKAAKAARGHGAVLIEGETGTGKEMLVRAMHAASPRAKTAFRTVNIGGVPASSLESVLFGHEKGAFAGAFDRQTGALQHCDGGTLVLDEVDRLSLDLQDRLIEALTNRSVRPIGVHHSFKVDVRVISASNLPLADLVATGHFRAELLELLTGTKLVLPPLRERAGDIPSLTRYFLARIGEQPGLRPLGITDGALQLLGAFDLAGQRAPAPGGAVPRRGVLRRQRADFGRLPAAERNARRNGNGFAPGAGRRRRATLHHRRQPAPARGHRGRRDTARHRPLSWTDDRSRSAPRDRPLDAVPQALRPRD